MLCAALTLAAGCGHRAAAHAPTPAKKVAEGWTESGVASWYGVPYDGRRTSSGEIFDMRALTAAHRTLPFDTWLEVTNLTNGKQVNVRVNDRGPFVDGRIIDLSLAAADRIDMVRAGIVRVKLKVIRAPKGGASGSVAAAEHTRGSPQ
jgi:rare lipoprotein A